MNFRKISDRGGGGHFRSKKFHCNFFCFRKGSFGHEFPEKASKRGGVISDLKNFIANLVLVQPVCGKIAIFFSEKGAGGGQRSFGNFPKIHLFWQRQASLLYRGLKVLCRNSSQF